MKKERVDYRPFRNILRRAKLCAVLIEIEWDGSANIAEAARKHFYKCNPKLFGRCIATMNDNGYIDNDMDLLVGNYITQLMDTTKKDVLWGVLALLAFDVLEVRRKFVAIDRVPSSDYELQSEPPRLAEFLVGLFAKKRYRNSILRDFAEDFDNNIAAGISVDRAKRRYWAAALNSIGPQALAAIKRIGLVGLVFDYARRWMG